MEKFLAIFSICKNEVKVFIQHSNSTLIMCTFSWSAWSWYFQDFQVLLVCKTVN